MNSKKEVVPIRTRKATLQFDLTLVPYKTNDSWVKNKILDMKKTLEKKDVPEINIHCEKCMFLMTGKNFI